MATIYVVCSTDGFVEACADDVRRAFELVEEVVDDLHSDDVSVYRVDMTLAAVKALRGGQIDSDRITHEVVRLSDDTIQEIAWR